MKNINAQYIDYQSENIIVLLIFCLYVIFWYLQVAYRVPFLGSIRAEFIYAAALGIIVLCKGGVLRFSTPILKYVIMLFFCIVIQIPLSFDTQTSWTIFIDRVLKFSAMALFIGTFVKSPRDLIFFLSAFLLACLKMGQEGFLGKITGGMIWENQGVMRLHGSTPLYAHPNSFSGMALGTLPFIYYLYPIASRWVKWLLIVLLAFSINIIIFTGSRTGYVAFIMLIIIAFMKSKKKKKYIMYAIIIGLLSIPFIPKDYVERFQSIFSGQDKEGHSTELRKEILKDALQIFLDHPLGIGVAAFPAVRKAKYGRSQDTHNLYLEVATNLGIQGFIVFILFIYHMIKLLNGITRGAYKQLQDISKIIERKVEDSEEMHRIDMHLSDLKLIHAVSSAVVLFLVVRLALGFFGMDFYEIYWWFALGLTTALYHMQLTTQRKTQFFMNELKTGYNRGA
mgnify:CR=1 FL=1